MLVLSHKEALEFLDELEKVWLFNRDSFQKEFPMIYEIRGQLMCLDDNRPREK